MAPKQPLIRSSKTLRIKKKARQASGLSPKDDSPLGLELELQQAWMDLHVQRGKSVGGWPGVNKDSNDAASAGRAKQPETILMWCCFSARGVASSTGAWPPSGRGLFNQGRGLHRGVVSSTWGVASLINLPDRSMNTEWHQNISREQLNIQQQLCEKLSFLSWWNTLQ